MLKFHTKLYGELDYIIVAVALRLKLSDVIAISEGNVSYKLDHTSSAMSNWYEVYRQSDGEIVIVAWHKAKISLAILKNAITKLIDMLEPMYKDDDKLFLVPFPEYSNIFAYADIKTVVKDFVLSGTFSAGQYDSEFTSEEDILSHLISINDIKDALARVGKGLPIIDPMNAERRRMLMHSFLKVIMKLFDTFKYDDVRSLLANVTDVTVDVSRLRHQAEYVFTDTQLDWFNGIMDSEDGKNFQFVADELSKEPMMPALKILMFNAFDYINHFTCN